MHYVIGDIHGHAKALNAVIQALPLAAEDVVTLVGDYIDHGPDSKDVVDTILNLRQVCTVRPLVGNHEKYLLASVWDSDVEREWLRQGGEVTLASFGVHHAADIPSRYLDFFHACLDYVEDEDTVIVHAGVDPNKSAADQGEETLFWKHPSGPISLRTKQTLIVGHSRTADDRPLILPGFAAIDTGMGHGGWLTCLTTRDFDVIQADAVGRLRTLH